MVALSYLFHQEAEVILQSFAGRLDPASVQENDGGIVVFAQEDNHFYVRAEVDGRDLIFLIDTGASEVVLSHKDARALRYYIETLKFTKSYNTANGIGRGAPITLSGIGIGSIYVPNVRASINETDMNISLLGMSFLAELSGYEVRNDRLIMYP